MLQPNRIALSLGHRLPRLTPALLLSCHLGLLHAGEMPAYQTLRYNEDWSGLRNSTNRTDFFDPAKYIPFDANGDWYLSLGGEGRLKYERYSDAVLNQQPADGNGFLLQRYLLSADLHAAPYFRVFSQLQSSLEEFRTGGPRPADEDKLDLHQLFADAWVSIDGDEAITLRAGRQEMAYGSQRLISVREAPNNRLAFDAIRLLTQFGEWRADIWLGRPISIDRGYFDDRRMEASTFWGGYVSGPLSLIPGLKADFYYLGISRDQAKYARKTADEVRHSLGMRLFGKHTSLDWNFEFVGQFGTFGNDDILAWTAASDTGWTFAGVPSGPRVFLHADIASGDHGGSRLGTFNPLFPRGAYFNEAALIGPQNLMDLQPGVDFTLTRTLKLTGSCDFVWRESLADGVYGIAMNLEVPPGRSRARYIGTFPSLSLSWQAQRHLNFTINYVPYLLGDFVTQSQSTQRDGDYVSVVATFRF